MMGIFIAGVSVRSVTGWGSEVFAIGPECLLLAAMYFIAIRFIWRMEDGLIAESESVPSSDNSGISVLWMKFALAAVCIVASSMFLAKVGNELVSVMGWSEVFVGTILLAITTSMPEIVVSIAALSMGSIDMALGNILGSNLFNILIIPITDAFYRKGPILSSISGTQSMTAMLAILLNAIVLLGLNRRMGRSPFRMGWETIALLSVFILGNLFFWKVVY